jgi:hypothetical protein
MKYYAGGVQKFQRQVGLAVCNFSDILKEEPIEGGVVVSPETFQTGTVLSISAAARQRWSALKMIEHF